MSNKITYTPNRVIDSDGISDGAFVYVYESGSTNLITIYTDESTTVIAPNPFEVDAGAPVPPLYYTYEGNIRVRVETATGDIIQDEDPYTQLISAQDLASTDPGKGAALVGFKQAGTSAVARTSDAKLKEQVFTPYDFGAVGDGVADDTAAINAMANAVALINGSCGFPMGTFRVTSNPVIRQGTKRVVGMGGVIVFDHSSGRCDFQLGTGALPVNDCVVEGLIINANGKTTLGIYGQNCQRCHIRDNYIYGLTFAGLAAGIYIKSQPGGVQDADDNVIEGNIIDGQETLASHVPGQLGIFISGGWTTPYSGYADATAEWLALFDNAEPDRYASGNKVKNNIINGGRYGIELVGTRGGEVVDNTFRHNTRPVSIQLHGNKNIIARNTIEETLGTGVGLGYSCSDNLISGNSIISSVMNSPTEGVLFAYVGCKRNMFQGNKIRNTSTVSGPRYFCYAAIHSDGTVFKDNEMEGILLSTGTLEGAYIALESAWRTASTNLAHRGKGLGSEIDLFANVAMSNCEVVNNTIIATSLRPAILLSQVTTSLGSKGLFGCNISANRIRGGSRVIEAIEETVGLNANHLFVGNQHPSTSVSAFLLPRVLGHFTTFEDPKLTFTATYDPPSIAANTSATTTVAVSGAAIGDFVTSTFSLDLAGISLSAYVNAANQVTVVFSNLTAGAVDLGSGTVRVRVRKQ